MNFPQPQNFTECLGWTLVHFLWQGIALAALLALALRALRQHPSSRRYAAAGTALLLMAATPVATFTLLAGRIPQAPRFVPAEATLLQLDAPSSDPAPTVRTITQARIHRVPAPPASQPWTRILLPWFVTLWLTGVAALSSRLAYGWIQIRKLRRVSGQILAGDHAARLLALTDRLGIRRAVRLVESAGADVPMVIGWLRPIILLPSSCLTGLTPAQLDSILAHELAHIRRHDYLVNLLQSVVETVLFYHPAVWWVSRRVREERENCCDDLAVQTCGDQLIYARALATLEEMRPADGRLALAAGGAPLLRRIRRLLGKPDLEAGRSSGWLCAAAAGMVLLLAVVAGVHGERAQAAGDPPAAANSPAAATTGRRAIIHKLENLELDSISIDHVPISEVASNLFELSRAKDPEGAGINFYFRTDTPRGVTMEFGDAITVTVPTLRHLRLVDALDAITRMADVPLKYSILDYAVVFSLKDHTEVHLETRSFRVNPNLFRQGLESVGGIQVGNIQSTSGSGATGGSTGAGGVTIPQVQVSPGTAGGGATGGGAGGGISHVTSRTNTMADLSPLVRQFFQAAGLDFSANNTNSPGRNLAFDNRTDTLIVTASKPELFLAGKALDKLAKTAASLPEHAAATAPAVGFITNNGVYHFTNATAATVLTVSTDGVGLRNQFVGVDASEAVQGNWREDGAWFVYLDEHLNAWAFDGRDNLWTMIATPQMATSAMAGVESVPMPESVRLRLPEDFKSRSAKAGGNAGTLAAPMLIWQDADGHTQTNLDVQLHSSTQPPRPAADIPGFITNQGAYHFTNGAGVTRLIIVDDRVLLEFTNAVPLSTSAGIGKDWHPAPGWFVYVDEDLRLWAHDGKSRLWCVAASVQGAYTRPIVSGPEAVPSPVLHRLPDALTARLTQPVAAPFAPPVKPAGANAPPSGAAAIIYQDPSGNPYVVSLTANASQEHVNAAVDEALRRESDIVTLRDELRQAQALRRQKDWSEAAKLYQHCHLLIVQKIGRTTVASEYLDVLSGLTEVLLEKSRKEQARGEYVKADESLSRILKLDPLNHLALAALAQNQKLLEQQAGTTPSAEVQQEIPALRSNQVFVATLIQDGKLYYQAGRLDDAEAKLQQAATLDPSSISANYYLRLIAEKRDANATRAAELASARRLTEVTEEWTKPRRETAAPVVESARNQDPPVRTDKAREAIIRKLEKIRLGKVDFDHAPLSDVLKFLAENSKLHDPDKQGIPFFSTEEPASAPGSVAQSADAASLASVSIKTHLKDVSLGDLLDAITKTADQPIKYTILDYGIMFSRKGPEARPLESRTFHVDPNTFPANLESALKSVTGVPLGYGNSGGAGGTTALTRGNVGSGSLTSDGGIHFVSSRTNNAASLEPLVRLFFQAAGVDFATNNPANPGKAVFLNDRKGLLIVHSTAGDLDLIQSALDVLTPAPSQPPANSAVGVLAQNSRRPSASDIPDRDPSSGPTPQVNLKVKVVEIDEALSGKAGVEWPFENIGIHYLTLMEPANQSGITTGLFKERPVPWSTNSILSNSLGVLTEAQFQQVMTRLKDQAGADFLTSPEITTESGRQAQFQVGEALTLVTGPNPAAVGKPAGTNSWLTTNMLFGVVVDLIPYVSADNLHLQLRMIASLTTFLGYEDPDSKTVAAQPRSAAKALTPLPRVGLRQVERTGEIADGQTFVLAGLADKSTNVVKDKVPVLGSVPLIGGLFRHTTTTPTRKNLLIFVTPTLLNPDGSRYHRDE